MRLGEPARIVVEIASRRVRELVRQRGVYQDPGADADVATGHAEGLFYHLASEHRPGVDRDDHRAVLAEGKRQMTRPHRQRQLALRVGGHVVELTPAGQRAQIDRRLRRRRQVDHPPGRTHQRQQPAGQQGRRHRIDRKAHVQPVGRDGHRRAKDARVVDQHVEPLVLLGHGVRKGLDLADARQVGAVGLDWPGARQPGQGLGCVGQPGCVPPVQQHAVTLRRQQPGRCQADAVGRAGDEDGLQHKEFLFRSDCIAGLSGSPKRCASIDSRRRIRTGTAFVCVTVRPAQAAPSPPASTVPVLGRGAGLLGALESSVRTVD